MPNLVNNRDMAMNSYIVMGLQLFSKISKHFRSVDFEVRLMFSIGSTQTCNL